MTPDEYREFRRRANAMLQAQIAQAQALGIPGFQPGGYVNGQHWAAGQALHQHSGQQPGHGTGITYIQPTAAQIAQAHAAIRALDNTPERTVEHTGIEVGEVIAWRVWRVRHGWLYSMMNDTEWEPGKVMEAHACSPLFGEGIHAFKSRLAAIEEYGWGDCVVGRVALWGEMVEFENGWHAQYARIVSLDYSPRHRLKPLQRTYGLEIGKEIKPPFRRRCRDWFLYDAWSPLISSLVVSFVLVAVAAFVFWLIAAAFG